jgi:type IV pilus assembly protein PilC
MPVYRYQGVNARNRPVLGILHCANGREARRRAAEIARSKALRLTAVQQRKTFCFRARRATGSVIKGEQKAFNAAEVETALVKAGYRVESVRARWFGPLLKPSFRDVVTFMRLSADLLREHLPYDEILLLLKKDFPNRAMREALEEIQDDLKDGRSGHEVFGKHAGIFGRFPAYMLGIASTSGNMVEVYESAAKFLERRAEFNKMMRSALLMPMFTALALLGVIWFYVGYIFPKTADLLLKYKIEMPPMTGATLAFKDYVFAHHLAIGGSVFGLIVGGVLIFRHPRSRLWVDEYSLKIPVLGPILQKTAIEIFCRVFHATYSGSGDNIEVIRVAAESCQNRHFEKRIKEEVLPKMIRTGTGFVEALESSGIFTQTAISRLRTGAETGTLRKTALQLANYYESETTYRLKAVVDLVQIWSAVLITLVMIGITVVSSETAMIHPTPPGVYH